MVIRLPMTRVLAFIMIYGVPYTLENRLSVNRNIVIFSFWELSVSTSHQIKGKYYNIPDSYTSLNRSCFGCLSCPPGLNSFAHTWLAFCNPKPHIPTRRDELLRFLCCIVCGSGNRSFESRIGIVVVYVK